MEIEVGPMEEDFDLLVENEWAIPQFESARQGEDEFPPAPTLIDYDWTFESISDRIYLVVTVLWEDTPTTVSFEEFFPSDEWRFTSGSLQNIIFTSESSFLYGQFRRRRVEHYLELRDGATSLDWKQQMETDGIDPSVQADLDRDFLAQYGIDEHVTISTDADERIDLNSSESTFGNEFIRFVDEVHVSIISEILEADRSC